jgi:peptidyl-dipeptidase Dcp
LKDRFSEACFIYIRTSNFLKMKLKVSLRLLYCALPATLFLAEACNPTKSESSKNEMNSSNPLVQSWGTLHNGVPPFDKVKVADFIPAEEIALGEQRNEIAAIAGNKDAANFKNTIEALEKTGNTRRRVEAVYYVWQSNMGSKELDSVQEIMEPRIASFNDSIVQNAALWKRIETVYNSPEKAKLTPEQQRLCFKYYNNFVLAGAKLDDKSKARVAEINQQLAGLFTKFNQHQLSDEGDKYLTITDAKDLAGLSDEFIAAAADKADKKGKKGNWIISNTRSSIEPFLANASNRALREKAWRMFITRGDNGDANDNNALIPEILHLRAERAKLLGYPTHAHWRLADKMAKTPERAMALLEEVWAPAVERVHEEVKDMQALADKEGTKIKIEAWDYRYYAEKVRKTKYDLDQNEVKQYLQLEKLREGIFFVAGELFNLEFKQVTDVPVFHPDVRVWAVSNKLTGKQVGLWYFDPYAREGKRSGAWETAYRSQEKLNGDITTIVSNNCNFIKGKEGEPVLISLEDARTLFHEFGHALHELNSNVTYPLLAGTNTVTDYVEFPSQLMERWLLTPEVLNKFALHYKTGQPIPQALVDKIKNASKFNTGFTEVELLASALVDMKIHLAGDAKIDPKEFEKKTLAELHMPSEIVMRHRLPAFGHIFSSDGYSAGYYSYCWSDVLSADAFATFTEAAGPYDKAVAKRLYDNIFSVGGTVDEATAYRNFRGHDPSTDALMIDKGFKTTKKN